MLKNVSEELEGKISELDGLEELSVGDQSKIKKAFEEGRGESQRTELPSAR